MWQQLVAPNLNVPAQLGMCLSYVQRAFNAGWAGAYAIDGWNRNKFNHQDRNLPAGVFLPIWFTGSWNGFNYGHVVVYKDGICYSSPYTNKTSHDQLGSIAAVERMYGMKYLGWSEDIGGTRVIELKQVEQDKEKDVIQDTQRDYDLINQTWQDSTGRVLTRKEFVDNFTGRNLEALTTIQNSPETAQWRELAFKGKSSAAEIEQLRAENAQLRKQLDSAAKPVPSTEYVLLDQPVYVKKQEQNK